MAQNQTLQHKRSTAAGNQPPASLLAVGELALNLADKSIYTKTPSNAIVQMARDVVKSATPPTSPAPVNGSLWYNTGDEVLLAYNGTTWVPSNFSGLPVLPANTTATPTWTSGSGTLASPYVFDITVTPGDTVLVSSIVVTGLAPGQLVPITDLNSTSNGGRFSFTNNLADGGGTLRFNVIFTDLPASAAGATLSASIRIGTATVYLAVTASMASSFPQAGVAFPVGLGSSTTSWTATADSLTSTGDIEISIDGTTYSQGSLSISGGDTLYTRWTGASGSGIGIDSANGTTITGSVVAASNGSSVSSSLVIDKTPDTVSFTSQTGVAQNTAITSNVVTIDGVNSYLYLTSANVVSASVNGGAFTLVPSSGTTLVIEDGQTLALRQTSSSSSNTATTVTVSVGVGSTSFTVTTIDAGIVTPTITSPLNGSTSISTGATITASAYTVVGSVGTHLNSDWEIYDNAGLTGSPVASSLASTANLTTWTPTELAYSTQYWARVRYRSNDGVAVVSSWSPTVTWTTASQPGVTWTIRTSNALGNNYAWNGSVWVTTGNAGTEIRSSSDGGLTWIYRSTGNNSDGWNDVVWTGSQFIAYSAITPLMKTSPDGITWTTSGTTPPSLRRVVYNGSIFVGIGGTNNIYSSANGISWTQRANASNGTEAIAWGNNKWIVTTERDDMSTSTDGITWTSYSASLAGNNGLMSIAWGNNMWVGAYNTPGGGNDYGLYSSPDGVTWTRRTGDIEYTTVIWAGNQFVASGGFTYISRSADGITWTNNTVSTALAAYNLGWNGTSLAVGVKLTATPTYGIATSP